MIKELRSELPYLCSAGLEVSFSGYYDWLKRPDRPANEEARLVIDKVALSRNRETYVPRDTVDLAERGFLVWVLDLRFARPLACCKYVKKFKVITISNHSLLVAEYLLAQIFAADAPNSLGNGYHLHLHR